MSKQLCENLDRVSKNLVNFRDKSLRDSSKFETEVTHIDEVQDLTPEKIVKLDASELVKKS